MGETTEKSGQITEKRRGRPENLRPWPTEEIDLLRPRCSASSSTDTSPRARIRLLCPRNST